MNTSIQDLLEKLKKEKDSFNRAKLIQFLYKERELTLKQIATYLNKHPSYVSHYLLLLNLPEIVLDGYYSKDISEAHLIILARLKKESDILKAYKMVLSKGLTTSQTEELIRELKFDITTHTTQLSKKETDELTAEIKKVFTGLHVKIIQSRIRGKIILELKGDTGKTTSFIRQAVNRLTRHGSVEIQEDDMQVLE